MNPPRPKNALAITIAAIAVLPLTAHAGYTFVNIIDTDDRTFNASLPIFNFGSPTLNNDRHVTTNIRKATFTADHSLILWKNGTLQEIVPTRGNQRLTKPIINASGQIAFTLIDDDAGTEQILRYNPDTTTIIAQTTESGFTDFSFFEPSSINDRGEVAFWAESGATEGIYLGDGTTTTTIAETGAQFRSIDLFFGLNNTGTVAFTGRTLSTRGVFTGDGTTTTTIIDGSDGTFGAFTCYAINDTGFIAYSAEYTPLRGDPRTILTNTGGAENPIVPRNAPFSFVSAPFTNDTGAIVFGVNLRDFAGGGSAILTGPDPVTDRIIGSGDALFGSPVVFADLSDINDNRDIAFAYGLEDCRKGLALGINETPGGPIPRITSITTTPTGVTLTWTQFSTNPYTIQTSTNTTFLVWTDITPDVLANQTTTTVPRDSANPSALYRVTSPSP